ncbi:hypothetical protein HDU91_002427, partial [Kappamyces sp. JEL0680]
PDILYLFATPSPEKADHRPNYPFIYWLSAPVYPFANCGKGPENLQGQSCCVSILNSAALDLPWATSSGGFLSGTSTVWHNPSDDGLAPTAARTTLYCRLSQENHSRPFGSLNGYQAVWIKADGTCIDSFSCFKNGSLAIYSNQDTTCRGTVEWLQPGSTFESKVLGNVSMAMYTFANASTSIGWIQSYPGWDVTVDLSSSFGQFSTVLFLLAAVCQIVIVFYSMERCLSQRNWEAGTQAVAQFFLFWYLAFTIVISYYSPFWQDYTLDFEELATIIPLQIKLLAFFRFLLTYSLNFVALFSTLSTNSFLLSVKQEPASRSLKLVTLAVTLLVHVAFAAPNYLSSWLPSQSGPLSRMVAKWQSQFQWYLLLVYFWNILPPFYIAFFLASHLTPRFVGQVLAIYQR